MSKCRSCHWAHLESSPDVGRCGAIQFCVACYALRAVREVCGLGGCFMVEVSEWEAKSDKECSK